MALAAGQTGHLDDHQEAVYTVVHGATAGTPRPTLGSSGTAPTVVLWEGSVEPTNAVNNDLWVDTGGATWVKTGGSFVQVGSGAYVPSADVAPNGQIVPPASTLALYTDSAWSFAGRAVGAKFTVEQKATYRYANFVVGTLSGNIQVAVCALDGLDYEAPIMDSGLVDMTTLTTGAQHMDLGATELPAGDYVIWIMCDNTSATVTHQSAYNGGVAGLRHSLDKTGVGSGISASGTASYGGRAIAVSLDLA